VGTQRITIFNGYIHLDGNFFVIFSVQTQKMEVSNFTSSKYATDDAHWNQMDIAIADLLLATGSQSV
jgi:hypothetical protein